MEKLLKFIKSFIAQFIAVFQDYRELNPISPEKRKAREAAIVTACVFLIPAALILILFQEPLGALFRVFLLIAPIGIVFFILIKSAELMDKAAPQQSVICYPVFRGFQPGSNYCQAAIVNDEFKEIAQFFESCYFDNMVDRKDWNCVVYTFQIRTGKELSYELIDLIQHICEKKAAEFFSEYGIYCIYSDIVACTFGHNKLLIAFAYNPQGELQIVNLRNQVYQKWHRKSSGDGGSMSNTMTENVPDIPIEEIAASNEEAE